MQFLIYTEDKRDGGPIRADNREAHLAWLRTETPLVKLLTAGPWLNEAGEMKGSLLIVEAGSKSNVETWLENDPYKTAGLPKSVTVKAFKWVIGAPG